MNYTLGKDQVGNSQTIMLGEKLGEGGEGTVWSVVGRPEVAKIYISKIATPQRESKLALMLANPPHDDMLVRYHHVSIAWPSAMLFQGGTFAGFLMPRLSDSFKILDIYNPKSRRIQCPGFNWKYLLHTALNLSIALNAVHARGYIIGDINEGNILVNRQALVSLIDTDSFQVENQDGQVFRCPVGKEEFTPPELHGIQFNQVNRLPQHDYFGLAVLIFLLLMDGNHPFMGVMKVDNPSPDPDNIYCLKSGKFPYASNPICGPRPTAPHFEILPPEIRRLMQLCFVDGYARPPLRPSPAEWVQALEKAEKSLMHCRRDASHWYPRHLRHCPWCATNPVRVQTPLPSLRGLSTSGPSPADQLTRPTAPPLVVSSPFSTAVGAIFNRPIPNLPITTPAANSRSRPLATPAKSHTQPTAGSKNQVSRDRFIRWLGPSGYKPKITPRFWWKNIQKSAFLGLLSGLAVAGTLLVMFAYPALTSITLSSIGSLLVAGLGSWLILFRFRFPSRMGLSLRWTLKAFMVGLCVVLGIDAWPVITRLASSFFYSNHPLLGWLILDGIVLGSSLGSGYGSFRLLARYKNLPLAFLSSLAMTALPFAILFAVGAFKLTFK